MGYKSFLVIAFVLFAGAVALADTGAAPIKVLPGPSISIASSSGTAVSIATTTYQMIAAPGSGKHLRIFYVEATNSGSTASVAAWREGNTGALRYETYLVQGATFAHNINGYWDLATNTAFRFYSSAAGNIFWTVEYVTITD